MSDYEIGYGKPPKDYQWQPGQSGNPSGSSGKKSVHKPIMEGIADHLCEMVTVTINGKKKKVPLSEVIVKSFITDLAKAPLKEKLKALQLLDRLGVLSLHYSKIMELDSEKVPVFTEEDRELLRITRMELDAGAYDDPAEGDGDQGPDHTNNDQDCGDSAEGGEGDDPAE